MIRFYYKHSFVLVLTLVCLLGWTPKAHAYLDLGTGHGIADFNGKHSRTSLYVENLLVEIQGIFKEPCW